MTASNKKRKASPLQLKEPSDGDELEALEATKKALKSLKDIVDRLDVYMRTLNTIMDSVKAVETRMNKLEATLLTRDCGPRPTMGAKPEIRTVIPICF